MDRLLREDIYTSERNINFSSVNYSILIKLSKLGLEVTMPIDSPMDEYIIILVSLITKQSNALLYMYRIGRIMTRW